MEVKLLDHTKLSNAVIGARTCYDSFSKGDLNFLNDFNFIFKCKYDQIVDYYKGNIEELYGIQKLCEMLEEDIEYVKLNKDNCDFESFIKNLNHLVSISSNFRKALFGILIYGYKGKNDFIYKVFGDWIEDMIESYKYDLENAEYKFKLLRTLNKNIKEDKMKDNINPDYYNQGKIKCSDAIESAVINKRGG